MTRRRVLLTTSSAVLCAAVTLPVQAVMPPEVYVSARQSAVSHLQIRIEGVVPPDGPMGDCQVVGEVVQVFRGPLQRGQELSFAVSCYRFGQMPAGGTLWTDYDALSQARYLEAFMDGSLAPRIQLDQVEIILAPREIPFCRIDSLSCETQIVESELAEAEMCGFFDKALVLWGLLGEPCEVDADESAPIPALRLQ